MKPSGLGSRGQEQERKGLKIYTSVKDYRGQGQDLEVRGLKVREVRSLRGQLADSFFVSFLNRPCSALIFADLPNVQYVMLSLKGLEFLSANVNQWHQRHLL